jgi:hypothetical protein
MAKKPIIISVLCVISMVLGYLSGLKDEESISNGDAQKNSKKEPEFLREGLVAYYPFNGNADDESGNGHNGIVNGATLTQGRSKSKKSAYQFDGKSWIELGNITQDYGNITFSAWVRVGLKNEIYTANSDLCHKIIISKVKRDNGTGFSIQANLRRKHFSATLITSNSSRGDAASSQGILTPEYVANWHHVVATADGKNVRLSLDGGEVRERSGSFNSEFNGPTLSGKPIFIGKEFGVLPPAASPRFFAGSIDDVRIYSRALSAEEVKALYGFEKAE